MNTDIVDSLVQGSFEGIASRPGSTFTPVSVVESGTNTSGNKAVAEAAVAASAEQIKGAVDKMNEALRDHGFTQQVQFRIEPDGSRVVIQVVESLSQQVIRQIPSEEALKMSQAIGRKLGQLIHMEA